VIVQGRELVRRYGSTTAVDGVTLTVEPGEIVGLSGPSGCGKSTLLRLLAGLERPDHGTLHLGGTDAWSGRSRQARYPRPGYVMAVWQDPYASLDPRWPLWRSITEPLTVPGRPATSRAERQALAGEWLDRVGVGASRSHARPGELSGGQCQRVAIARALIAQPSLLVADEPTARQDVVTTAALTTVIREVLPAGTGVVLVSHDRRWLEMLAHRVQQLPPPDVR